MLITPLKTPIVRANDDLKAIITYALPLALKEKSVLVVTSKIVALCEGSVIPVTTTDKTEKNALVRKQAELYTEPTESKYELMLTLKDGVMQANAGIDLSNADHQYVLHPENSQQSATDLWHFLREKYGVKHLGIVISDSRHAPMRWGSTGVALGYCGIKPLKDYRGTKDLFEYEMVMTTLSIIDGLASVAVLEMGEGAESTPLCLIEESVRVEFVETPPTDEELASLKIRMEDDMYAPILMKTDWKKGGKA